MNVMQWISADNEEEENGDGAAPRAALLWCVLDRREWDPRGWRQRTAAAAHVEGKKDDDVGGKNTTTEGLKQWQQQQRGVC